MSFPVCREEIFGSHLLHRKRGRSARASPSPHYTLAQERTARFTARPFSALIHDVAWRGMWICVRSKAPVKRSQHVNATYRNIVGRNMLRAFGHRVATCWVLLGQV